MKLLKKSLCLFLASIFALLVGYTPFTVNALSTAPIALETKIFSQASIEDDFVDNHVLVVLTNEASLPVSSSLFLRVMNFEEFTASTSSLSSGSSNLRVTIA